MANRQDFALENNDLIFANGDFVISISDEQHIADTINAHPGWWKEFPSQGVGISSYLGASVDPQDLQKKIRLQLEVDRYQASPVVKINPDGTLNIVTNANSVTV